MQQHTTTATPSQPAKEIRLSIKNAIKVFGLEALRGRPVEDGNRTVFISHKSLDDDIELWSDEPENAYRTQRFYGGDTPDADMVTWIYTSAKVTVQAKPVSGDKQEMLDQLLQTGLATRIPT